MNTIRDIFQPGGSFTAVTPGGAPPRPRVVAIVVTHNREAHLRRTVTRLLEECIDHLLVVDNASQDGTRAWLQSVDDPRLTLVLNDRNLGGAGGFECGLRAARARFDADWYVLMDDDARPYRGTIARFREMVTPRTAPRTGDELAVAPAWTAYAAGVHYPDGSICETNRPSRNPFWNLRSLMRTLMGGGRAGFHVKDTDFEATSTTRIHASSFVGLFLSRDALAIAGYPQGDLFIYGDDVLYTLGLSAAGGRIGFAPWLHFEHNCTTFGQKDQRAHRPLWKVYYNYRNGLMAYRFAAGPLLFWPVLLICLPKWLSKIRAYQGSERRVFLRLLGLAVGDGLLGRKDRPHDEIRERAETG